VCAASKFFPPPNFKNRISQDRIFTGKNVLNPKAISRKISEIPNPKINVRKSQDYSNSQLFQYSDHPSLPTKGIPVPRGPEPNLNNSRVQGRATLRPASHTTKCPYCFCLNKIIMCSDFKSEIFFLYPVYVKMTSFRTITLYNLWMPVIFNYKLKTTQI
jgi:hypothetical protein